MCVPGLNCYSCPGAAGACPLGSLQNALAVSGKRAPHYVLGIVVLFGVMLGRTICGYLCPTGLLQEIAYKLPTPKLKKCRATRMLSWLKYVILLVLVVLLPLWNGLKDYPLPAFCKYICPAGTLQGAAALLLHPDNADKYAMLGSLFAMLLPDLWQSLFGTLYTIGALSGSLLVSNLIPNLCVFGFGIVLILVAVIGKAIVRSIAVKRNQ